MKGSECGQPLKEGTVMGFSTVTSAGAQLPCGRRQRGGVLRDDVQEKFLDWQKC